MVQFTLKTMRVVQAGARKIGKLNLRNFFAFVRNFNKRVIEYVEGLYVLWYNLDRLIPSGDRSGAPAWLKS